MATIQAGMNFPTTVITEMFDAVRGHSALAKLSDQAPIPFNGATEFVFNAAGEAALVGEGDAKPAGNASVTAKVQEHTELLTLAKDDMLYLLMDKLAQDNKHNGQGLAGLWILVRERDFSKEKCDADFTKISTYLEENE